MVAEAELENELGWFLLDYNDQQVFMNQPSETPQMPPAQLLENVGNSIIYGLESEVYYQPYNDLALVLTVGYIPHAEFEGMLIHSETVLLITACLYI